ncbi:OsmC family protein [Myxococcota bacterium]|nr:OsmC family protein [Myxococcota bacterium]MBU1383020.1 OsmC family protein [Myxococcota bacterium]MBU1495785.1 OsmC family protein [Myxococcota bacterium]
MSEMIVSFPGNKKVDVSFGDFVIQTDQSPRGGGDGSAPEPYSVFLASLAACAGIYALAFCQARDIDTEGLKLIQTIEPSPMGGIGKIKIHIELPYGFPEKYVQAIIRAADQCAVKRTILNPPAFEITADMA